MMRTKSWATTLVVAAAMLLVAAGAFAQNTTGNVFGTVTDDQGAPLPGVNVTISGVGAPLSQVTDAQGQFRFPGLAIGTYKIDATLEGFSTVEFPAISVSANQNRTLQVQMSAAIQDVITVTTESPLLDERRITTGSTITNRINVGGNESGQQSVFVATGAATAETTWAVDGVNITDVAARSSPAYFDFDAFEEVQFTTGGSDVALEGAGVTVNIVTKRGTNEWRGSARYNLTDGEWQSDPSVDLPSNQASFLPNEIGEVKEYGVELGGPIVRDRLWIWAAYGTTDPIDNIVGATGQHDITVLENTNGKLNAQIIASNSANVQYNENDKLKDGRGAGASRAPETTTDQSGVGGKPNDTLKIEDTQVVNSNFYLTGMYSFVDGGFQLVPKGGISTPAFVLADGVYRGSYYFLYNNRDVTQYKIDGSTFFNTGSVANELKFGASHRLAETSSVFGYAGNFWVYDCDIAGCTPTTATTKGLNIYRDSDSNDESEFEAVWLQDTITMGNFTANAGLRYETATGKVLPASISGVSKAGTTFLPSLTTAGIDPGIEFEIITPRFGVTYAMGAERRTLLRASLSRFANQFLTGNYTRLSSTGSNGQLRDCVFNDANNNNRVDDGEVGSIGGCRPVNFNPANPNSATTPSITDPNLDHALTDELLLSFEHALRPEFVVSAGLTYRLITDIHEDPPLVRVANRSDYVPVTSTVTVGGVPTPVSYFVRRAGVTSAGGSFRTNGDREQEALGLTLGFNKRLTNRWMLRGHMQYTDWTWKIPNSYFDHNDPTDFGDGAGNIADGDRDGETVASRSGGSGSKGGIFLNAGWSGSLTGLYQVAPDAPWGFNIGGALNAREGYPSPVFRTITGSDGTARSVQISKDFESSRNDDVFTLDLRLDKEIMFGDAFGVTLGLDVFNVFNNNEVLQRNRNAGSSSFNFVQESISPRILRAGVRLSFK
jgi:hypothetical protein